MDASTNLEIPAEAPSVNEEGSLRPAVKWDDIRNSPAFYPGLAILIGLLAAFWPFVSNLPGLWFDNEGYYSHGVLVPLISGYVIYRWWPGLSQRAVKPAYLALVPLLAVLWVTRASIVNQVDQLSSVCFIAALLCSVAFIAGWRWMFAVMLPTLYLGFAFPIWNMAITYYTNPLQVLSTKMAYGMLKLTGFNPWREGEIIHLNHFTLDVGIPCSGLKLVLALYAFTIFFALIARLKPWANFILIALVPLPLALFINGLRIMLIGVVGEFWGADASHQFHDYSGYITLIVCFIILFKIARWLGWKD